MVWPFTRENMGDDARDHVIRSCREGVDPRGAVEDYGEHDRDYTDDQHRMADGYIGENKVPLFYESTRRNTVKVKKRK